MFTALAPAPQPFGNGPKMAGDGSKKGTGGDGENENEFAPRVGAARKLASKHI